MDTSFAAINRSFCRNASGAILVSDITDAKSLEDAASWKEEVDQVVASNGSPIPMVLASNKLDLLSGDEEELYEYQQQEFLDRFAKEHGFIESIRCSAKEDIEIAQLFSSLTREMLIKEIKELENEDENDYVDDGEFRDERTGSLTLSANQAIGGNSVNASQ